MCVSFRNEKLEMLNIEHQLVLVRIYEFFYRRFHFIVFINVHDNMTLMERAICVWKYINEKGLEAKKNTFKAVIFFTVTFHH